MQFGACDPSSTGQREWAAGAPAAPATDFPLPLSARRWGPSNRNGLHFREVRPRDVWGDQPERVLSAFGEETGWLARPRDEQAGGGGDESGDDGGLPGHFDTDIVSDAPFSPPGLPGLRVRMRTRAGDTTVDWLDGHAWMVGLSSGAARDPHAWLRDAAGPLFGALRGNRSGGFGSHPHDGYMQFISAEAITVLESVAASPETPTRVTWRQGSQWALPPMQAVLFLGEGGAEVASTAALGDWPASMLRLSSPPGTTAFFKDLTSRLHERHLLCTPRPAVVTGAKPKLFTGRADAWLLRQYAYQAAGLSARGVLSHPRFPPRMVTILDGDLPGRAGAGGAGARLLANRQEVEEAVRGTGLPYQYVRDVGALPFDEQVALMAGTGILVTPHGSHLAAAAFLPAHSAIVELFPALTKANDFRHMAAMLDLHYFPVHSWDFPAGVVPVSAASGGRCAARRCAARA